MHRSFSVIPSPAVLSRAVLSRDRKGAVRVFRPLPNGRGSELGRGSLDIQTFVDRKKVSVPLFPK